MNSGALLYRYRLCGQTFAPIYVPDVARALVKGRTPRKWGVPARLHHQHVCVDRRLGVGDLIGGQEDEGQSTPASPPADPPDSSRPPR
jgi:hypothetical protein